jgi:hypothetical protein
MIQISAPLAGWPNGSEVIWPSLAKPGGACGDTRPHDLRGITSAPESGHNADQMAAVIWGPCRFNPGLQDTDPLGREHGPFSLLPHEPYALSLESSAAPSWWTDLSLWRRRYEGKPIRLEVTCRCDSYEPWVVLREIVPVDPSVANGA